VHDHVKQGRDEAQVAGHRGLPREQREDALVDLQVAPVEPVVVGDHHPRELHVLAGQRVECAVELLGHDVDRAERLTLELRQLLVEVRPQILLTWGGRAALRG